MMRTTIFLALAIFFIISACNQRPSGEESGAGQTQAGDEWRTLFAEDLSNADYPEGVWTVEDGALTASEDQVLWTNEIFENFMLDLEFKLAESTNSGVIVYCSDKENWIPNSVEIQIADDYAKQWAESPETWQCGAIFGHLPASDEKDLKRPGEWNHYVITCRGQNIRVELNGQLITDMDMSQWTSATTNPDGSPIPEWLSKPLASLEPKGYIGFQGKHAGAPIWFRNIKIKELE